MELYNGTDPSNETDEDSFAHIRMSIDAFVTPILYVIGFPGNIISLIIWLQKRMRHSSGYYLAALALDDLIFLALHLVYELHDTWKVPTLDYPVMCEGFPVLYLSLQHLSPFLVLAFTTERYISICHPFKREKYCTVKRAKIVIICLVILMPCLNAANGYFYYIVDDGRCGQRPEVVAGASKSIFIVYTTIVDMIVCLLVPVSVLVLNVLVIREMRRLSNVEHVHLRGSTQKTGSTTVMLLAVSFYQIITTLPISITYALYFEYNCESGNCNADEKRSNAIYNLVLIIIKEYGTTHYVFNIFIYICTGKMFRQELNKFLLRPFLKLAPSIQKKYASLRSTTKGSERSRTWMSTNGNHDIERTTDETLL